MISFTKNHAFCSFNKLITYSSDDRFLMTPSETQFNGQLSIAMAQILGGKPN